MIKISVVIPNLNSPIIHQTIDALEEQTFDRKLYEVIVVGMDKFGLVNENERTYFDQTELPISPAAARNRGATQANGEILAFTDADCIPQPNWLEIIIDRFKNPELKVLGGSVVFDTKDFLTMADNLSFFHDYLASFPPGPRSQLASLNLSIRRDIFNHVGGFDERYPRPAGEDSDLTIRLRKAGNTLHFEPRAIVYHLSQRHRLSDLIRHHYYQGVFSTKVNSRYIDEEKYKSIFGSRLLLILLAPVLALIATINIFKISGVFRKFWKTIPIIYLSKFTWCIGAANHPNSDESS